MNTTNPAGHPITLSLEQALSKAIAHHEAGQLEEAEILYQSILHAHPNHPEANHNMGVLAVQRKQPASALGHFMSALEADPKRGQYWLSYIDALFQAGQLEAARDVLILAQKSGLQGEDVDAMAMRLEGDTKIASQPNTVMQHASNESLPVRQGDSHSNKTIKTKVTKENRSSHGSISKKRKEPSPQEVNALVALLNAGQYAEVEALARTMTVHFPLYGYGWKILGAAINQMGRSADALVPMQTATKLMPADAESHINLGVILQNLNYTDDAAASYKRAIQINPKLALAHGYLGTTLHCLGRVDEAEACYRRALEINPDNCEVHSNLGVILQNMGRLSEAEACYRRALEINPYFALANGNLGITLEKLGRLDDALTHYQQQAKLMPGNVVAQHQIASLTGENTERAPIQYVENVFDNYANYFDTHLQQVLEYDIPKKLAALITRHLPSIEELNILDLGCGTGLVGLEVAKFARLLVGVDLSAKMLEKARARNLYHRLERSDLITMMQSEPASSFDVIIAADVFVYLGKLDEIVSEVKRLLCPSGVFAFSVETFDILSDEADQDYQLKKTGRYVHSARYLNKLASAEGFLVLEMMETQIRTQDGKPVNGLAVLWKNTTK